MSQNTSHAVSTKRVKPTMTNLEIEFEIIQISRAVLEIAQRLEDLSVSVPRRRGPKAPTYWRAA